MSLLTARQVEQTTGVPAAQLARWRRQGIGPEYFKLGHRTIRYSSDYIHDWIHDPGTKALLKSGRTGVTPRTPKRPRGVGIGQ